MVRSVAHTKLQLPYSKFSPWCSLHCLSVNFTLVAAAFLWLWLVKEEVLPYFLSQPAHLFPIYSPVLGLKGQLQPLLFARSLSPLWWYQATRFTECFLVFWPCSLLLLFCALYLGWILFPDLPANKELAILRLHSLCNIHLHSACPPQLPLTPALKKRLKQELKPQIFSSQFIPQTSWKRTREDLSN